MGIAHEVAKNYITRPVLAGALVLGIGVTGLRGCASNQADAAIAVTSAEGQNEQVTVIEDACITKVIASVADSASYKQKYSLVPPRPTFYWKEELKARKAFITCYKGASVTRKVIDSKVHLVFDPNTVFTSYVYSEDPLADSFTSPNNAAAGILSASQEFFSGFPVPDIMKKDEVSNLKDFLQQAADVVAEEYVAVKCAPVALDQAKTVITHNMINAAMAQTNEYAKEHGMDESSDSSVYVVDFPTQPTFESQNTDKIDELKNIKGVKVTLPNLDTAKDCKPSTEPVINTVPAGAVG